MDKKKVCCIFGGRSEEYEVSLSSAYTMLTNLDLKKYDIMKIGASKDGRWYIFDGPDEKIASGEWINDENLSECFPAPVSEIIEFKGGKRHKIDKALIAMHGRNCEDGRLQGLLDSCMIDYTGPKCLSSAICMDKAYTKVILKSIGIKSAEYFLIRAKDNVPERSIGRMIRSSFGFPAFIKPSRSGSSVGISKVKGENEIADAIEKASNIDERILIEANIRGKEIEVAALPDKGIYTLPGEVEPGADFYEYQTKYRSNTVGYHIPARLSERCTGAVVEYSKAICRALMLSGSARIDFFVTENEDIYFNEVNTLPGFTNISMFPMLMENRGLPLQKLLDEMLE